MEKEANLRKGKETPSYFRSKLQPDAVAGRILVQPNCHK